MKKIDAIGIPAGKVVEIKPGGYHIMLMGLRKPLKEGYKVKLNLQFEKSGIIKVQAELKPMTGMTGHIMMNNMNH
jgi:periplasmic copper chaperone A